MDLVLLWFGCFGLVLSGVFGFVVYWFVVLFGCILISFVGVDCWFCFGLFCCFLVVRSAYLLFWVVFGCSVYCLVCFEFV